MENLNDLRKELKKINCNVKVKNFSFSKSAIFVVEKEEINHNVFTPGQLEKMQNLINFCKKHSIELKNIREKEKISGLTKYC